jgi:Mn-dependent DtxR family transcriptional regulator
LDLQGERTVDVSRLLDVAATLEVSTPQAKAWLKRLADEGILEKRKQPVGYVVKQTRLFQ